MTRTLALLALAIAGFLLLAVGAAHAAAIAVADPTSDPAGFVDQLFAFAHTNWALAAFVGLYGALELAAYFGRSTAAGTWLGKGRITLVISGGIAVLGAGLNAAIAGGTMQSVLVAAVVALAAWWHPAASNVLLARATNGR